MPSNNHADIVGSFPNPTLPPIVGLPTYTTIAEMHLLLNQNAASVDSNLGGGQHGLLGLTVSPAIYATVSPVLFVLPAHPGQHPVHLPGATAAQISEANRLHDVLLRTWQLTQATDKALKQLLLAALDPMYVHTLRHRLTGFAAISTRQLLDHLYLKYGRISAQDLEVNDKRLKAPYDVNQPIETLFDQISQAIDLADAAGAPYTPAQIINHAYSILLQTVFYGDACKEWRRLAPVDKTWVNFQLHFAAAHDDLREAQATAQQGGYHQAHTAFYPLDDDMPAPPHDTITALANLAHATAADRTVLATLTTTIQQLTNALERAQQEVASLRLTSTTTNTTPPPAAPASAAKRFRYGNYCWSHGFRCGKDHTSETCKWPKDGHQRTATATNQQGGSIAK
jgi:hypothetical protein